MTACGLRHAADNSDSAPWALSRWLCALLVLLSLLAPLSFAQAQGRSGALSHDRSGERIPPTLPPGPDTTQAQPTQFVPAPANSPTVISVEAHTEHADSMVVVRSSGLGPGDKLSRAELQTAIRRIYATGLFSQIEAETTMVADGVRVLFKVKEIARLKAKGIHYEGNHKISTRDLNNKLAAKDKEPLTDARLFQWTSLISDAYKNDGYILVKVTPQVTPPDARGEAEVTFFVEEGENIRIKEIHIKSDGALPEKDVLGKMANKPTLWPIRRGLYKDDEFKKDLERITDYYKEKGYLDAKVLKYDLKTDQGQALITIDISDGIKYHFGRLVFKGESLLTMSDLQPAMHVQDGTVYNQKKVNQTLTDLYGLYSEQGYIYTQIQPVDSIRFDTVDIRFQIVENKPARIRLVSIEGNDRTQEKVIRREIVSMPGSTFKRSEVMRSQQDIYNLGFFEDVSLDYKRVTDTTSDIDLTYKVKEKFPGSVGAGVSYSATDGIVGYVELTQPNLFGRAQSLHVKFEKGSKVQNVELGFNEPWLFDTPTSAGISLFYTTQNYDYYDRTDRGGELTGSRPLTLDYTRGYVTLHVGDTKLSNITAGSSVDPGDTMLKTTISATFRFDRDSRDYIFNPLSGSLLSYTATLAGATVLGDVHFQKHIIETDFYWPLFWKFGLRLRNRLGFVTGLRPTDTVPPYERFYPGGSGDDGVRGYADRTLPTMSVYSPGGLTEGIFSLEYRCRVNRSLTVLAFFDAGNAWPSVRDINLSDLKRGAGVGARVEIPMMGWLGLDLGYGFDNPNVSSRFQPHFQLGAGLGNFAF